MLGTVDVHSSLQEAILLHQSGQLKQASTIYQRVLDIEPENANALHLLGLVSHQSGQPEAAIILIKQALGIAPNQLNFLYNLANILRELGQFEEAVQVYRQFIRLQPDSAEAYNNLGISLHKLNQFQPAAQAYRDAIELNPVCAETYYNFGTLLQKQGELEKAVRLYQKAIEIDPEYAEVYNNFGTLLQKQGELEKAVRLYQKAIEIDSNFVLAYGNLGDILHRQGQIEQATQAYRRAIEIQPDYAKAHNHLGITLLLKGDFQLGWQEYEWRLKCENFPIEKRGFSQPVWDGSSLHGKAIFLYAEQGFGDTIQFIRYVYILAQYQVDIIFECQFELLTLFESIEVITQLIVEGDPLPDFDFHAPLLSLPRIFRTDLESIPSKIPYLCPKLASFICLSPNDKLRIGIAWAGNPKNSNDDTRLVDLQQFSVLFEIEACQFYGLQVGDRRNDIAKYNYSDAIIDLGADFSDFSDTASAIAEMDLVISVDTSTAHLTGALGKMGWILLPWIPDWRWLLDRKDTPWYPTMRLFRQTSLGDWTSTFQQVYHALKKHVLSKSSMT